jgi:hypothetical protein
VYRTVLLLVLSGVLVAAQPARSTYYLERRAVNGGAELVTVFGRLHDPLGGAQDLEVPLLSVLRDTLGDTDPENDRLRYVWILTSVRPNALQRAASALSFFCFRAGTKQHDHRVPAPALDLASPASSVWTNLIGAGLQSTQFDALGKIVRISTRSYRGNSSDYRKVQLFQALGTLDGLEREADGESVLSDAELRELYARLGLSNYLLGGLVRLENLSRFYDKETARAQQLRGHNWELLRQRAELSGLFFEPLALPGDTPTEALLWVAREDLAQNSKHPFEGQFLNIANPWTDERLENWSGYTEIRYLDSENRPTAADAPEARRVERIPLALYSLDHPRVPLLLADFRDTFKPKGRELVRHGANVALTGVLGITRFGNWSFFAADSLWTFVRGRHGAAVDRSARLRAYSQARGFLAVDSTIDPKLKAELFHRLDHLALNPLENGIAVEAQLAREQYNALLEYAGAPDGLIAKLERDRRKELASYTQSKTSRFLAALSRPFRGASRPNTELPDPALRAGIDAHRRSLYHERFLERLLASSPRPDVVWNTANIVESVEALSDQKLPRAPQLIAQVFARSEDAELRVACLRALRRLDVQEARNELWRLSQAPATGDAWRALCLLFLRGDPEATQASASGGQ